MLPLCYAVPLLHSHRINLSPFYYKRTNDNFQVRVLGDGTHDHRRGSGIAEGDAFTDVTDPGKDRVVRPELHRGGQARPEAALHRRRQPESPAALEDEGSTHSQERQNPAAARWIPTDHQSRQGRCWSLHLHGQEQVRPGSGKAFKCSSCILSTKY